MRTIIHSYLEALTIVRPKIHNELRVDVHGTVHVPEKEDDSLVAPICRAGDVRLDAGDGLDLATRLADMLYGLPATVPGRSCERGGHIE